MPDTDVDNANIELVRTLFRLREDLDVYEIISANSIEITRLGRGKTFFAYVQHAVLDSIVIQICKIYEQEKRKKNSDPIHALNSINGIMRLIHGHPFDPQYKDLLDGFIVKYSGNTNQDYRLSCDAVVENFRKANSISIKSFQRYRNKFVAHSEQAAAKQDIPSFEIMHKLLEFAYDFYRAISDGLLGFGPVDLNANRSTKVALMHILKGYGVKDIRDKLE